ncbi:hypothetical protein, partial [Nitratidesulfovibrio liaohensis]|uniref:hypothetical protein n=1 Tax=Nitratidesulfovibrio liaohensis TaxID=2604158 RepID=UPI001AAFD545
MLARLTAAAMRVPLPPYTGEMPRTPHGGGAGRRALRAVMSVGRNMRNIRDMQNMSGGMCRAAGYAAGCVAGCMLRLRELRWPGSAPHPALPA